MNRKIPTRKYVGCGELKEKNQLSPGSAKIRRRVEDQS